MKDKHIVRLGNILIGLKNLTKLMVISAVLGCKTGKICTNKLKKKELCVKNSPRKNAPSNVSQLTPQKSTCPSMTSVVIQTTKENMHSLTLEVFSLLTKLENSLEKGETKGDEGAFSNLVESLSALESIKNRDPSQYSHFHQKFPLSLIQLVMSSCLSRKYIPAFKNLLTLGISVNGTDREGNTPLHIAIRNSSKEVVELLLQHGANLNNKNQQGKTALGCAIGTNKELVTILLQQQQVDINAQDNQGCTPLDYAMAFKKKEIVQLLLAHNCEVNTVDNNDKTPLHYAVRDYIQGNDKASKQIVKLLLKHGANPNIRDHNGDTPLNYVIDIDPYKANKDTLTIQSKGNNSEIMDLLLEYGANSF